MASTFDLAPPPHPIAPIEAGSAFTQLKRPIGPVGEGFVTFPSCKASYRYTVAVKENKLQLWLEDCVTKKQWESAMLSMEEFTSPATVIPCAGFLDYVSCFQRCLEADTTLEASEFARDLVPHASDDWEMHLTLKIKVFVSVWTVTYSFVLKQISLEAVDVLSAKIRDQSDKITTLENDVALLKHTIQRGPVFVQGVTTESKPINQKLMWKLKEGDGLSSHPRPVSFDANGDVTVSMPGVYAVHVVAATNNRLGNASIDLHHNGEKVASTTLSGSNGLLSLTPLQSVLALAQGDRLACMYTAATSDNNNSSCAGSSLVMYQFR